MMMANMTNRQRVDSIKLHIVKLLLLIDKDIAAQVLVHPDKVIKLLKIYVDTHQPLPIHVDKTIKTIVKLRVELSATNNKIRK